jgi:hypothetical protein
MTPSASVVSSRIGTRLRGSAYCDQSVALMLSFQEIGLRPDDHVVGFHHCHACGGALLVGYTGVVVVPAGSAGAVVTPLLLLLCWLPSLLVPLPAGGAGVDQKSHGIVPAPCRGQAQPLTVGERRAKNGQCKQGNGVWPYCKTVWCIPRTAHVGLADALKSALRYKVPHLFYQYSR